MEKAGRKARREGLIYHIAPKENEAAYKEKKF